MVVCEIHISNLKMAHYHNIYSKHNTSLCTSLSLGSQSQEGAGLNSPHCPPDGVERVSELGQAGQAAADRGILHGQTPHQGGGIAGAHPPHLTQADTSQQPPQLIL